MAGVWYVTFDCHPDRYRHWSLTIDGDVATLTLDVDPQGGLSDEYELKLNSYDLAVDIELSDAVLRLRFEHPEVHTVVVTGGMEEVSAGDRRHHGAAGGGRAGVFCSGANIQMLAAATHHHKVNFCRFTNETRLAIEDASQLSGQVWLAALNGTAAGGGYELALACDEIVLVDDRASAVSLPELPLLGVLPGTGGLTRLVDKRGVRRDRADFVCTRSEGIKGEQAVDWHLVDAAVPRSRFADAVAERATARAAVSDRPASGPGVTLTPLHRTISDDAIEYDHLHVRLDPDLGAATFNLAGPEGPQPSSADEILAQGDGFWPLALCRELDDAVLHLRFNRPSLGTWVFRASGDASAVLAVDDLLGRHLDHWLVREIVLYWTRTLKRLDASARSLIALVEPGTCYAGTLAELVLTADRSFMLESSAASLTLAEANTGWYPMANGLTRLATRFWGQPGDQDLAEAHLRKELDPGTARDLGLVTFTPDDIDWDDEVRLALEERASFSPDALTGLEANLRFVGPETLETKIFGRLSAWQNWIFQRPNAVGEKGALS
ncbi:MAG TPA: 2,3-epoxybenzoyl-CoA dihydrolase, partial [Acidimicrobiales bacterium]